MKDRAAILKEFLAALPGRIKAAKPSPNGEVTNADRAEWARICVELFAVMVGNDGIEEAAGDLVGDMIHLADAERIDWCAIKGRGEGYHLAEVIEELIPHGARMVGSMWEEGVMYRGHVHRAEEFAARLLRKNKLGPKGD